MQGVGKAFYWSVRKLWQVLAIGLVLLAVIISLLKFSLPYANDYRENIESILTKQLGTPVTIGSIDAAWQRTGPELLLNEVAFGVSEDSPISIDIKQSRLHLNLWQSVLQRRLVSNYFVLDGMDLMVAPAQFESSEQSTGFDSTIELLETLFLADSGHFAIENSRILMLMNGNTHQVELNRITWQNENIRHQGVGQIRLPGISENTMKVVFELYGEHFKEAFGELYVNSHKVDISPWLREFVSPEVSNFDSEINFELWGRFDKLNFEALQLNWQPSFISWQREQPEHLAINSGNFKISFANEGWQIETSPLTIASNQTFWPEFGFRVGQNQQQWHAVAEKVPFALAAQVSTLFDGEALSQIRKLEASGELTRLGARYKNDDDFFVRGDVASLAWRNQGKLPGANDLALSFVMAPEQGLVKISGENNHLQTGDVFVKPLAYDQLNIELALIKEQHWLVQSNQIWLHNNDLTLAAELSLNLSEQPDMALYAELQGLDAKQAIKYYPHGVMPQGTIDYLTDAIKDGEVPLAQVLWQGEFNKFPFEQNDGRFMVEADVQEGRFSFHPSWPDITDLKAKLSFVNERMDIYSQSGNMAGLAVGSDVSVSIDNLGIAKNLYVDIHTQKAAQKLPQFFQQTPLADSLGAVLQLVVGKGEVAANTRITVPLNGDQVLATGEVNFNNLPVTITTPGIEFNRVNGVLTFANEKLDLKNAQVEWHGMPLEITLTGRQREQDYQLAISGKGDWPLDTLLDQANGITKGYLAGTVPINLAFTMNVEKTGFNYNATVTSSMTGVTSTLPNPYNKDAEQSWPLEIQVRGDEISNLLTASVKDKLYFNAIIDNQTAAMSNAHFILAPRDLGLNRQGFDVYAELDNADLLQWIPFIDHLIEKTSADTSSNGFFPPLGNIQAQINKAQLASIGFDDVSVRLDNVAESIQVNIQGKQLRSEVSIPKVLAQRPIYITTDYLRLNFDEQTTEEVESQPSSHDWLANLPAIRFSCGDCKIGNYQLDKVYLNLDPADNALQISELKVDKGKHQFLGSGRWQANRTNLKGVFNSKDIGELTDEFGLTSTIKDSKADIEFALNWQGAPFEFNSKTLSGDVKWRLGEGHLTDISDGGARVFSLLSLDSLVRKLKLDFRDVFGKGFFYNNMKGTLLIENGVASTNDTVMDGVPADLTIKGYANLNTREINYDMWVAPEVTSSLPVIAAWLVNPVTGIAAFALDKMIHSARVISEIEFSISGTFDEPIVTEKGRKSKEVALPVENTSTPTEAQQPQLNPAENSQNSGLNNATNNSQAATQARVEGAQQGNQS